MNFVYRQAIISFCPDLTDPGAASYPVASLIVGSAGKMSVAAAVVRPLPAGAAESSDPITRNVLSDLPHLLKNYLNEAVRTRRAEIESLLYEVHGALRSTVFVSDITPTRNTQLYQGPSREMFAGLIKIGMAAIAGAPRKSGVSRVTERIIRDFSEVAVWRLPRGERPRRLARA